MNDFINALGRGIDKVTTFTVGFLLGALTMITVGTGLLQMEIEKGKKDQLTEEDQIILKKLRRSPNKDSFLFTHL